ncbi:MAG: hypothetical protein AAGA55_00145, partial [Planctomycetota bacterium]
MPSAVGSCAEDGTADARYHPTKRIDPSGSTRRADRADSKGWDRGAHPRQTRRIDMSGITTSGIFSGIDTATLID